MANEDIFAQPVPNLPLLRKVLDHIDAHPEEYEQATYTRTTSCGTAYCIAGHAAVMTGATFINPLLVESPDGEISKVDEYARSVLGITALEAFCHAPDAGMYGLFAPDATREHVQLAAVAIAERAGERL